MSVESSSGHARRGRAAGPAGQQAIRELLEPVVRRRLVRVIVDGDGGVSLDAVAEVNQAVSAALDEADVMGSAPYVLEVSSPGVDRPLTEPRHWRRAAGRLVKVKVAGEGTITGRVLAAGDSGVTLDLDGA